VDVPKIYLKIWVPDGNGRVFCSKFDVSVLKVNELLYLNLPHFSRRSNKFNKWITNGYKSAVNWSECVSCSLEDFSLQNSTCRSNALGQNRLRQKSHI
jgi:hypothetical protein